MDYLLNECETLKSQEGWQERSLRWKEKLMEVGIFNRFIEVGKDFLDERLV